MRVFLYHTTAPAEIQSFVFSRLSFLPGGFAVCIAKPQKVGSELQNAVSFGIVLLRGKD